MSRKENATVLLSHFNLPSASASALASASVLALALAVIILFSNGLTATPLHKAARKGSVPKIEKILDAGKISVNDLDKKGYNALYYASETGKTEAVKTLLQKGAKVNLKSKDGSTALHWASANGQFAVAKILIANGANVHARKKDGYTPLHSACLGPTVIDFYAATQTKTGKGRVKIVKLLLAKGAKVNAKSAKKWTPLNVARYRSSVEGVYSHKIIAILENNGGKLSPSVSEKDRL